MSESDATEIANVNARMRQLVMQYEETQEQVADLAERVEELEETLDALAGVGEGQSSTPEKRALDLRQLLLNSAQAKQKNSSDNPGMVQWDWKTVQTQLESNGHGTIHAPQAYRAMEEAATGTNSEDGGPEGYAVVENNDGNRVVRCSLPALTTEAVNEINNAGAGGPTQQTHESEVNTSDRR